MTNESLQSATISRETAASHMVTRFPRATADTVVSSVIQSLRGQKFECADVVFVTDADNRLRGIVKNMHAISHDQGHS